MQEYILSLNGSQISFNGGEAFKLKFTPKTYFDENVLVSVAFFQIGQESTLSNLKIRIIFIDQQTDDVLYDFTGTCINDDEDFSSIVSVMEASEEFTDVDIEILDVDLIKQSNAFNALGSLGRAFSTIIVPQTALPTNPISLYDTLMTLDETPSILYHHFRNDVQTYSDLLRVAERLNIALWIELDPTITVDQAISMVQELAPQDHRVRFLWSPIVARPLNAVSLKGRKLSRLAGGFVLAKHMLRAANTNAYGIAPLHNPIAGYDYPLTYVGIEQRKDVVLDDPTRKRLANAKINVVQRMKYPNGIRFIVGDCLTAYPDNNSLLKLNTASDISMFIDNTVIEIIKKHLLKNMDSMISDSIRECTRLLEACTARDRKLLKASNELGGNYYALNIVPRQDRPYDAVDVSLSYHIEGTTRAAYLNTTVTA